MRRSLALVLAVTVSIGLGAAEIPARGLAGPVLVVAPGVPNDVRALADGAWRRFVDAFPARRSCIPPVTLLHSWSLTDRATYDPKSHVIVLRVPATAATLRATLIHEFGHHLEFTCPAQRSLRATFLAGSGLPADARWFGGRTWEDVPSERFAEAVTVHVLGTFPSHLRVPVSAEALEAIQRWATGAPLE